jgi:WD40 repeat protein
LRLIPLTYKPVIFLTLPFLGALHSAAFAQAGSWSAPVLDYVYDSTARSLRPLTGIPGSASLESALAVSSKLEQAAVSPTRKYALASNMESGSLLLLRLSSSGLSQQNLDGSLAPADVIAFSSSGDYAAIYSSAAGKVQVWKGLNQEPALDREFDANEIRALAISDDAVALVAATGSGLVSLGQSDARSLSAGESYKDLAFIPGTHTLLAVDDTLDQVVLMRRADSDAEISMLAGAAEGIAGPFKIAVSADAQKVIVANARTQSVLVIDLASRALTPLACDCTLDGLYRTQGNAVFRLTASPDTAISLLDADAPEPRILTIPGGSR